MMPLEKVWSFEEVKVVPYGAQSHAPLQDCVSVCRVYADVERELGGMMLRVWHLQAMKRPSLLRASDDGGKVTDRLFDANKLLTGTVTRRNWSATDATVRPLRDTSAAIFTPSNTSMAESPAPSAELFHEKVRDKVQEQESQTEDLKFRSNKGSGTMPARCE